MPRDPKSPRSRWPRDPGTRPQTPWLNSFNPDQRRFMHWYLDAQVILVQKLFYQKFQDWRLKLQLNIGQPQQFLSGYSTSQIRLLDCYARQQAKDFREHLHRQFKTAPRSAEDINKALFELRMWIISMNDSLSRRQRKLTLYVDEHEPGTEKPPSSTATQTRSRAQDLAGMLKELRMAPEQAERVLQIAAACPEQHEVHLKHCVKLTYPLAAAIAVSTVESDAGSDADSDVDPTADSAPASEVDESSDSEEGSRVAKEIRAAPNAKHRGATTVDSSGRRTAAAISEELAAKFAGRSGPAHAVQPSTRPVQPSTRPVQPSTRAVQPSDHPYGHPDGRERAQAPPGADRPMSTQYDDVIRHWTAATHVDAATRQAQLALYHQARQQVLAGRAGEQQQQRQQQRQQRQQRPGAGQVSSAALQQQRPGAGQSARRTLGEEEGYDDDDDDDDEQDD
ncbi:hypothetical protein LTR65_008581 [Meristemomyces frigidus]